MKKLKFGLTIFYCLLLIASSNKIIAQINSTDVFKVHKASGSTANYFTITSHMDALVSAGMLSDIAEDKEAARYNKWNWFWEPRASDASNPSTRGDFSNYMEMMSRYSKSSACPPNTTDIIPKWNLKGPVQLPTQNMGRVDVIRTVTGSTIAFAGTPNSALSHLFNYHLKIHKNNLVLGS